MVLPIGEGLVELQDWGWGAERGLLVCCFFCCRAEETLMATHGHGASHTLWRGGGLLSLHKL